MNILFFGHSKYQLYARGFFIVLVGLMGAIFLSPSTASADQSITCQNSSGGFTCTCPDPQIPSCEMGYSPQVCVPVTSFNNLFSPATAYADSQQSGCYTPWGEVCVCTDPPTPSVDCGSGSCAGTAVYSNGSWSCDYSGSNGASCDDGNSCTTGGTCSNGSCSSGSVVSGTHLGCLGNACANVANTSDSCSNSCTGNSDCGGCVRDSDCDDGNPCTQDTCAGGSCSHDATGSHIACDSSSATCTLVANNTSSSCSDTCSSDADCGGGGGVSTVIFASASPAVQSINPGGSAVITVTVSKNSGSTLSSVIVSGDCFTNASCDPTPVTLDFNGASQVAYSYTISTNAAATGNNTIHFTAQAASSCSGTCTSSASAQVNMLASYPPTVTIDGPSNNQTVSGGINVNGWAIDNTTDSETLIFGMRLYADGNFVATITPRTIARTAPGDLCSPQHPWHDRPDCPNAGWTVPWDSTTVSNGSHVLRVEATDSDASPQTGSASVTVNVLNYKNPSLVIDGPAANATVSGVTVIDGWAIDNTSQPETLIDSLKLYIDDNFVSTITPRTILRNAPGDVCTQWPTTPDCQTSGNRAGWSINWDTNGFTNGTHTIKIVAVDSDPAPHSTSATRSVTIQNYGDPFVWIDSPYNSQTVSGTVMVQGWALDTISQPETHINSIALYVDGDFKKNITPRTVLRQNPPGGGADVCNIWSDREDCTMSGGKAGWEDTWDSTSVMNGTHTIRVVVTDNDPVPHTAVQQVSFTVYNPPVLALSPTSFDFSGTQGLSAPPIQNLTITNTGYGSMNWTASISNNTAGCVLGQSSGSGLGHNQNVNVAVSVANPSSVPTGTLGCTITITGNASNSPQSAQVTYTVSPEPALVNYIDGPCASYNSSSCPLQVWGITSIAGWGVDNSTFADHTTTVTVYVDNVLLGTASRFRRDDVCTATNPAWPDCPNAGYTINWDTNGISENTTHTIKTVVTDTDVPTPQTQPATITVLVKTPSFTTTNTGVCETANLSWSGFAGQSSYRIFRNTTGVYPNPWDTSASNGYLTTVAAPATTYTDTSVPVPGSSANYYYYVAGVNSAGWVTQSLAANSNLAVGVVACTSNLHTSDKDVSSIMGATTGIVSAIATSDCNGYDTVPATQIIKSGDIITFTINMCNSTSFNDATSLSIVDRLTNVQKPSGGWQMQYQDTNNVWQSITPAENLTDVNNPVLTITFPAGFKVPKKSGSVATIRKLTFKGIAAPIASGSTSAFLRNRSTISYKLRPTDPAQNDSVDANTGQILYYNSKANVPTRQEKAPQ